MTNPMTPTEQDNELREQVSTAMYDTDYEQVTEDPEYFDKAAVDAVVELIIADRKRVALEARIDERSIYISDHINGKSSAFIARVKNAVEHEHSFDRNSMSCKCGVSKLFMVDAADEIAELKAQQEEL